MLTMQLDWTFWHTAACAPLTSATPPGLLASKDEAGAFVTSVTEKPKAVGALPASSVAGGVA